MEASPSEKHTPEIFSFIRFGEFTYCPKCPTPVAHEHPDSKCPAKAPEQRLVALESLWVAVKELNADGTGYTPKLAEAVARLRKLEAES